MLAPELVNEQYRIFQAHNSQAYIESERAKREAEFKRMQPKEQEQLSDIDTLK